MVAKLLIMQSPMQVTALLESINVLSLNYTKSAIMIIRFCVSTIFYQAKIIAMYTCMYNRCLQNYFVANDITEDKTVKRRAILLRVFLAAIKRSNHSIICCHCSSRSSLPVVVSCRVHVRAPSRQASG